MSELHRITGIPLRTLEDWEAERSQIASYHRMKRLAGILNCDVDELMTKEENCLYGQNRGSVFFFQEENGVHVKVYPEEDGDIGFEPAAFAVMPRKEAIKLLKHMKKNLQIKDIIEPYLRQNG